MKLSKKICRVLLTFVAIQIGEAGLYSKDSLNIAKTKDHPYVRPEGAREDHRLSDQKVNEFRVYDFYSRQADFYLSSEKVPEIIPAFPGLDAGEHGHWGKYNQNGHEDGRWNDMQHDGIIGAHCQVHKGKGFSHLEGGIVIELDPEQGQYALFSPRDLNFLAVWQGNKPDYGPFRWGTSRGLNLRDTPYWQFKSLKSEEIHYKGYYWYDGQAIFSYDLNGVAYLDHAQIKNDVVIRSIQLQSNVQSKLFNLGVPFDKGKFMRRGPLSFQFEDSICQVKPFGGLDAELVFSVDRVDLQINKANVNSGFKIYITKNPSVNIETIVKNDSSTINLNQKMNGGEPRLSQHFYQIKVIKSNDSLPYVVDDIEIPFKNAQKSMMFLSGIDFDQDGHAYVSTLMGEVWKVSGLAGGGKASWKKIASGLNQPFGLRIYDGDIYVMERTRISVLKDLNGDDEIDYYENYNNQVPTRAKSHTHKFGLERDSKGDIYFINDTSICRVRGSDRQYELLATGVRNCMGVGSTLDGAMLFGPQEGTNTPTTAIMEVFKGDFYGHKGQPNQTSVDSPMCYVPRGVDNSVGGFFQVNDERWGPLGKSIIGLSYGYGQWYQVIRKKTGSRSQGATIPMPGQFFAGVVRAATNPIDGQVYTVGLDGWGDYSTRDGCMHRIRYTGQKLYQPIDYEVFDNGLRLDFSEALDRDSVSNIRNYFAQMWDYLNSGSYGSPEYSHKHPERLGHDRLMIRSAHLLNGGKSIFVEIPDLVPVMQMHLHLKLKAADGVEFKADIFPTITELGAYHSFSGALARVDQKNRTFNLRYQPPKAKVKHTITGEKDAHARVIKISAIAGMKYDQQILKAKAGESIALVFENKDGMPHNLVIVHPGQYEKVGMTSFKMLNDPKAAEKHYVPQMPEVLASTYVIQPKAKHTTYFQVPKEKGEYMFLCTFPGHWQLMKGKFIVE